MSKEEFIDNLKLSKTERQGKEVYEKYDVERLTSSATTVGEFNKFLSSLGHADTSNLIAYLDKIGTTR